MYSISFRQQSGTMETLMKILQPRHSSLFSLRYISTLLPPQQSPQQTQTPPSSSAAAYDELIHEAGKSRNYRRLYNLLIRRIDAGFLSTNNTFRFITNSQAPVEMLGELVDCLASLPNGVPRQNACDALVRRLCKIRLLDNALKVLDEMRERNLELSAFSFRPVFELLIKNGELEKAEDLLWVMKEYGVRVDTSSFNYVLKEYCDEGDVAKSVDLLEKMEREELVKGDVWTYNAMVLGACKAGKVEGAVAVLRAAIDDGMKLTHYTYEHVIGALLAGGYYEQAVKFVMVCGGRYTGLDNEIFDFLAVGLNKCERPEETKMVVDEMSRRGLVLGSNLKKFL